MTTHDQTFSTAFAPSRPAGSFANWIKSIGVRIATWADTWADTCADYYAAATMYEQLSAFPTPSCRGAGYRAQPWRGKCALHATAVPNLEGDPLGTRSVYCRLLEIGAMPLEEITLLLFTACNSVPVVTYVPQILKAATDKDGAFSISSMTWSLFLLAHLSTVAYAIINRSDWGLAACFAGNAVCCLAILAVAYWKRREHAQRLFHTGRNAVAAMV